MITLEMVVTVGDLAIIAVAIMLTIIIAALILEGLEK